MKILLLSALAITMIGLMVPSAFAFEDKGDFYLVYSETENYKDYENWVKEWGYFELQLPFLNDNFKLPYDIPIYVGECEELNAWYYYEDDPPYSEIVICYELIEEIAYYKSLQYDDDFTIEDSTVSVVDFILYHELGHAFIHLYNLPITGAEEDVADQFATYVLLTAYDEEHDAAMYVIDAAEYWLDLSNDYEILEEHYAGLHSLDIQRFYDLACYVYGSDSSYNDDLIEYGYVTENRADYCYGEYYQILNSWDRLLEDFKMDSSVPSPPIEDDRTFTPPTKLDRENEMQKLTAADISIALADGAKAGERMAIEVTIPGSHVNWDIIVIQNGEIILDERGVHSHNGFGRHVTSALSVDASADNPIDVTVTFQGFGMPGDEMTGPVGLTNTAQADHGVATPNVSTETKLENNEVTYHELVDTRLNMDLVASLPPGYYVDQEIGLAYVLPLGSEHPGSSAESYYRYELSFDSGWGGNIQTHVSPAIIGKTVAQLEHEFEKYLKLESFGDIEIHSSEMHEDHFEILFTVQPKGSCDISNYDLIILCYRINPLYWMDYEEHFVSIVKLDGNRIYTISYHDYYNIEDSSLMYDFLEFYNTVLIVHYDPREVISSKELDKMTPSDASSITTGTTSTTGTTPSSSWYEETPDITNSIVKSESTYSDEEVWISINDHDGTPLKGWVMSGTPRADEGLRISNPEYNGNIHLFVQDSFYDLDAEIKKFKSDLTSVIDCDFFFEETTTGLETSWTEGSWDHHEIFMECDSDGTSQKIDVKGSTMLFKTGNKLIIYSYLAPIAERSIFANVFYDTAYTGLGFQPEQSHTPQESEGGGCLIATAAYGSEMAPQVQFLRELRDNTVMSTQSGTTFMTGFNQFYYSFSPQIADYERENPVFKEAVKVTLAPLLTSLTLLNYVEIDSEEKMLGYGIGIILLNIGMYFVVPAILVISIKNKLKNRLFTK